MRALTAAVRDTIGTGIYFVTYESVKQILTSARGSAPASPLAVVVAGGMCGLVSWACVCCCSEHDEQLADVRAQIFPIDTAKSIYQRNCLVGGREKAERPKIHFFHSRMYRGMYLAFTHSEIPYTKIQAGLGVSMGRSCVVNAIFFTAFEFTKKRINRLTVDDELLRAHET